MDTADTGAEPDGNHDERRSSISAPPSQEVVIVGGGPAGCSAGIFCAREGLDTLIFDRGQSSLRRYAHLENYLGFSEGIDIKTFLLSSSNILTENSIVTVVPTSYPLVAADDIGGAELLEASPATNDPSTDVNPVPYCDCSVSTSPA